MGYKEAYKDHFNHYKELLKQYEDITLDNHYLSVCEDMPFAFLEAKHKAETLELYRDIGKKDEAPFKFSRADEAITFLRGITDTKEKVDEILENASVIVRAGELAHELNTFIENSPYLSNELMISENDRIVSIAKDCLKKLPGYSKMMTKAFRYSFIESCIESLQSQGLKMVAQTGYIKPGDMKNIRLTGSDHYEKNIAFLQEFFGLKDLICEHQTIRLAGTTHKNEDGSSRQDFLKEVGNYKGEIPLKCTNGIYHNPKNGKDVNSVEIAWNGKILGYVPQAIVDNMFDKYGDPQFKADFIKIVGGGSVSYGCEVEIGVVAKELVKEDLEEDKEM